MQDVFISLLSHPKTKHLSRESCSLGLAACRGLTSDGASNHEELSDAGSGTKCSVEELNHRLLRAFGQTTKYGGSAYQETREQAELRRASNPSETGSQSVMERFGEENQIGGASGIAESALNSYKEMAAGTLACTIELQTLCWTQIIVIVAAVSLGRADVLYALLLLSVSHEVWFSATNKYKYSAASLLGSDSTDSESFREALKPHLGKLLPRILRARHDPNKQTREQMNALWLRLTGGGSEARFLLSQQLLPTVDTLVEDCTSKFWRARAGGCGALAEILVGCSWESLGGGPAVLDDDDVHVRQASDVTAGIRLLRLYRVSMRALDDVRSNVREAGEVLARTMRGLSIRLCNPKLKNDSDGSEPTKDAQRAHERDASAASATTLRWLVKHGLNQQCPEAIGICLSTLVAIINVVKPTILQPLIPDLLKSLLLSMSGLEPSALNYLQARSGAHESRSALSYDNLERVRLRLAQTGPLATALGKLLEMLPSVSVSTQKEVVPMLDAALRQSVGFATRAATADAVSVLCSSCPHAFQFPGASSTNPSVRLLRALWQGAERERGQGARDKMTHALGNLAALCPGSAVRSLALRSCSKYNRSTGNNDDPASRRASAATLRSIAVRATSQFSDGGPSDIWFRRVLPTAFLGKKDPDTKISGLWSDVWEEGSIAISTSHMSSEDHGTIEELLLPYIVEECCRALLDLSWSRRVSGANGLLELSAHGILSPASRRMDASISDISSVKRSKRRAEASKKALNTCVDLLSKPRLWTGKSSVADCAVSISVNWAPALAVGDSGYLATLGWELDGTECPWQPILVAPEKNLAGDLFAGDDWFGQKHNENEPLEPTVDVPLQDAADDDTGTAEDDRIEFEECDNADENNEKPEESFSEETLATDTKQLTFAGFASFLMDQAMPAVVSANLMESEEFLPYRVAALKGLRSLMASLTVSSSIARSQKRDTYMTITPRLLSLCDLEGPKSKVEIPPVIVARGIDCIASCCWLGMSNDDIDQSTVPNMLELAERLKVAGGEKQPAWAVREATRLCLGFVVTNCHVAVLREQRFVSVLLDCAAGALSDRKFWKVRFAGLSLLRTLVQRPGTSVVMDSTDHDDGKQLVLEAILPHKEEIMRLARRSLADSEAKVTALGSDIIGLMAWWP